MTAVASIAEHIVITPDTCGGKPRIAGHRIPVQNIAICRERMGLSPEEIVEAHPTISLADVHAALAYFYDHREEILESIRQEDELAAQIEASQPSILERIKTERPEAYRRAVERSNAEEHKFS